MNDTELENIVRKELKEYCGVEVISCIKAFKIKQALPKISNLTYTVQPSETQLRTNIFLAGDYLMYGSLNAAMQSGELAAQGLMEKREGTFGLH